VPGFARRGDFWSGLVLAGLGAYILSEASHWIYLGEDGPGPGFFPMWYGGAMLALSVLLVAGTVLRRATPGKAASIPELRRALTCWAAFAACVALMKVVGFMIAFAALAWFIVAVMARQSQKVAIPLAVGCAVLFYLLFDLALEVSLPAGIWF